MESIAFMTDRASYLLTNPNRVRTSRNVLTGRAAVRRGHAVGREESGERPGEGRIGVAVGLARGVGGHRRGPGADREERPHEGQVVVAIQSERTLGDRVGAQ